MMSQDMATPKVPPRERKNVEVAVAAPSSRMLTAFWIATMRLSMTKPNPRPSMMSDVTITPMPERSAAAVMTVRNARLAVANPATGKILCSPVIETGRPPRKDDTTTPKVEKTDLIMNLHEFSSMSSTLVAFLIKHYQNIIRITLVHKTTTTYHAHWLSVSF
jgi:hypothetical protein